MTLGRGAAGMLSGAAEAAQCARTRLGLVKGEWFLDVTAGVRYFELDDGQGAIFAKPLDRSLVESEIKTCLLGTVGIAGLTSFAFVPNRTTRRGSISASVITVDGDVDRIEVAA
jgi:hypothetical protein